MRVALALLLVIALAGTVSAQTADQWFVLDKFTGLNLYLEKTKLEPNQALLAKNIQFRKPGTISVLEGLTLRDTVATEDDPGSPGNPVLGFGVLRDMDTDSSRLIAACSTTFWYTYGDEWNTRKGGATTIGLWQRWTDSTRLQSVDDSGRAAEFLRPGWVVRHSSGAFDTIDYISDNNTIFLDSAAGSDHAGQYYASSIYAPLYDATLPVQFVPITVDEQSMLVCLQAGMEPVLYNGDSEEGLRYFGIADSGTVGYVHYLNDDSNIVYIVDNSKLGVYLHNDLAVAGYWLHTPYNFGDTDSSHWGRMFPIDSNAVVAAGDSSELRIYFRPSQDKTGAPGYADSEWFDSLQGSRYSIISAPLARDAYTEAETPSAVVEDGGITLRMATGTIEAREFDHIPHKLVRGFAGLDSTRAPNLDSLTENCYYPEGHFQEVCETTYVEAWRVGLFTATGWPIRTSFIDTAEYVQDTVTSSPTDTSINAIGLTQDSGYWVGAYIKFLSGAQSGESATVEQYYSTNDSLIFGQIAGAPAVQDTFILVLDTTDSLILWTSGENVSSAYPDITSDDWSVARLTIPYASDGIVYNDRLYLAGDPQAPNYVVYSEPYRMGAFPQDNGFAFAANGDVFTGFALIYDWLVIFQRDHTWVLKGDYESGGVLELALPDEGCIAVNSIVEMENHIVYLSNKGWRIFDGNTAKDFALPIKPGAQSFPRVDYSVNPAYRHKSAAGYDPQTGNVWMSQPFGTDTLNSGSWLYNFVDGSFAYSDEVFGAQVVPVEFQDTSWLVFTHPENSRVYTYGRTDSAAVLGMDNDTMNAQWSTGWLDMGHPEQIKYIEDGSIHAQLSNPYTASGSGGFYVNFYKDFDTVAFYADTLNPFGIIAAVWKVTEASLRLEPMRKFEWLRVEITGDGLNVMDVRRLALRYGVVGDVVRDLLFIRRP